MTHHAPSLGACILYHDMSFTRPDYTDYYYASRLGGWLSKNNIYPKLWTQGHIHISTEYKICDEKVIVVVNSYGYKTKSMPETTNYKAKVVEI